MTVDTTNKFDRRKLRINLRETCARDTDACYCIKASEKQRCTESPWRSYLRDTQLQHNMFYRLSLHAKNTRHS